MQNSSSKLNIAMLGQKRVPSREGGVEIVVEELSTRMVERGHNVTLYNRRGHHVSGKEYDIQSLDNYKGVEIRTVPTIEKKGLAAASSALFAACAAAFGNYDVVHFHAEGPCFFCWIPKLFGKKVVATIHGLDWARAKWGGFASWFIKTGEKNAVKYADEIIVLSKNVQKYFKDTYNRDTAFIPNGVSMPNVIKNETEDTFILYLGRIVPEKGIHYLIEAFIQIEDEIPDKKLIIAGGASDTDEYLTSLKELAGDDKRIEFVGFVQGRELEELYSNAWIYCLPSDLEGMPLSLLEAMSYDNCCIVSDIEECTEVVEDKTIIFEKGNVKDLAEKIKTADVAKYKKTAQEFILNKYNWDDVVDKTLELYGG